MTKAKKGSMENPISDLPEYVIASARLNDGKVDFSWRILKGIHKGEIGNIKGIGLFHDSLQDAFNVFNVHLSVIDEAYKHKGVEISDIDTLHADELAMTYSVTGFKIKGEDENESIILIGTKYTSLGDISIETPKITLDALSSYTWYNELKQALENVRQEVAAYKEGSFIVTEKEEKPTGRQMKIGEGEPTGDDMSDFEHAAR